MAFADIVGVHADDNRRCRRRGSIALLNGLFTRFDDAARELGIEKIKTVGDAYMAVCGLPVQVPARPERMGRMANAAIGAHHPRARDGSHARHEAAGRHQRRAGETYPIGKNKYIYDLWGDTVNLASRMGSGGMPGPVKVTRSVYEKLKDEFVFEARGEIEVKGKGSVEAWLLKL